MFFLSFFVFMSFCLSSCSHQGEEELFISIIWAAWWLWANKIKKVAQIVCRTQNNRYLCSVKKCWWKPSSLHQHSKRIICGLYLCRASHYFFKHERANHNQTSGPTTTTQVDQPRQQSGPSHGNNWPLPRPLPRREGRDYRDTPIGLLLVAYGAICGCIIRCSAHFASLFVYIESSVKYVHSVILCHFVILS